MKYLAIPLMLFALLGHSQKDFSIVQSPGSYDDGFSFGIQYEKKENLVYYGGEIYVFPDLNDLDYAHIIGRFGFNILRLNEFTFHIGGRGGFINRNGSFGYAVLGAETGVDFYIEKWNLLIGLAIATDTKTDSKVWGSKEHHTVNSGLVTIGFRL